MDDPTLVRLVLLLVGSIPVSLSIYGLCSGTAFLPTNRTAGKPPWVQRVQEPAAYWAVVLVQMGCGLFLASLPYWRR
jgi:hypothetical protein